jgi:hypothetical protein
MQRGIHIKKTRNDRRQLCLDIFSSSFFAFLFSFSFVFAQASAIAGAPATQLCETEAGSRSATTWHFIDDHNQALHFPINAFPTVTELETKDGRESDDNANDAPGKLFPSLALKERFDVRSHRSLLLQLLQSSQNRKEVSLFILHHSWKSFLS